MIHELSWPWKTNASSIAMEQFLGLLYMQRSENSPITLPFKFVKEILALCDQFKCTAIARYVEKSLLKSEPEDVWELFVLASHRRHARLGRWALHHMCTKYVDCNHLNPLMEDIRKCNAPIDPTKIFAKYKYRYIDLSKEFLYDLMLLCTAGEEDMATSYNWHNHVECYFDPFDERQLGKLCHRSFPSVNESANETCFFLDWDYSRSLPYVDWFGPYGH